MYLLGHHTRRLVYLFPLKVLKRRDAAMCVELVEEKSLCLASFET